MRKSIRFPLFFTVDPQNLASKHGSWPDQMISQLFIFFILCITHKKLTILKFFTIFNSHVYVYVYVYGHTQEK